MLTKKIYIYLRNTSFISQKQRVFTKKNTLFVHVKNYIFSQSKDNKFSILIGEFSVENHYFQHSDNNIMINYGMFIADLDALDVKSRER